MINLELFGGPHLWSISAYPLSKTADDTTVTFSTNSGSFLLEFSQNWTFLVKENREHALLFTMLRQSLFRLLLDSSFRVPFLGSSFSFQLQNCNLRFIACHHVGNEVIILFERCQVLLTNPDSVCFLFIIEFYGDEARRDLGVLEVLLQHGVYRRLANVQLECQISDCFAAVILKHVNQFCFLFIISGSAWSSRMRFVLGGCVAFSKSLVPFPHHLLRWSAFTESLLQLSPALDR